MTVNPEKNFVLFKLTSFIETSHWTEISIFCAERWNISYSTEKKDVMRSTNTELDVAQEKRIHDCWNVDENRSLSDSWTWFTKFTVLKERDLQKEKCGRRGDWQKFKQLLDQSIVGQKRGPGLGKPLKRKKNRNGQSKSQNSRMPENLRGIYSISIQMTKNTKTSLWRMRERNWRHQWRTPCRAEDPWKLNGNRSSESWKEPEHLRKIERQDSTVMWKPMNPKDQNGICHEEKSWRPHCRQKTKFNISLQLGAQVHSYAACDENSGCKGSSESRMEKDRDYPNVAVGESQKEEGGHKRGTDVGNAV